MQYFGAEIETLRAHNRQVSEAVQRAFAQMLEEEKRTHIAQCQRLLETRDAKALYKILKNAKIF